ncbi:MAG TPA: ABC transporter substrate-binding protein [Candidatus Binatia bacterium]|nr:ABC transporter substrate-binding protein [Candidatus Binatia bacterium]
MKKTYALFLTLALLLAACSSGPLSGTPHGSGTLVIGGMYPLTGDGAAYGIPIQHATDIAIKELNDAGGIGGKDLKIVWEDSKCDAKDGATAAQKLTGVDNVKVILGGICSGETLAAAPITEEAGVILLSPSSTNPKITDAGDFVFRTAPSDAYGGKVAAEYARKQGYKTVSIIAENSDYAQGLRTVFRDSFKALGGSIANEQTFDPDASDFKTIVLKVVDIYPDAVYLAPQTPAKGVLLLKQLREQGYKGPIVTAEVLIGRDVIKEHPDLVEGIAGVEVHFDETNPKAKKLFDEYRSLYNEDPPFPAYMAAAYDNVNLIADAIGANDGEIDADQIKDYLYHVKDYDGALGKLTFDQNGDPILDFDVKKVIGGNLVVLG